MNSHERERIDDHLGRAGEERMMSRSGGGPGEAEVHRVEEDQESRGRRRTRKSRRARRGMIRKRWRSRKWTRKRKCRMAEKEVYQKVQGRRAFRNLLAFLGRGVPGRCGCRAF